MKVAKLDLARDCRSRKLNSSYKKLDCNNGQVFNYLTKPANISYYKANIKLMPRSVSFLGHTVHIVDGGNHATNMQHFANAVSDDMDIKMHNVEVNKEDKNIKQLKSLEEELKNLNSKPSTKDKSYKGEFIAIPALASVAILNIQDQYNIIMKDNKRFTPQNIKANKKSLLEFLKILYQNPNKYRRFINYMDPKKQGIEYTYGVIQEINKLIEKGAMVYVPSGHPQDETLKWMAAQRGLKPELYHYIATGEDVGGKVKNMHKEIKANNWYDFNLLSLSNANIVGVKGAKGAQDYMFAAYDSCITDGERGVYNFSPVRKNGELVGYSYTDTFTNEYPFEEFPANDEVENLVKFVGKKVYEVIADYKQTEELKDAVFEGYGTSKCADKLYHVEDVFSEDEIRKQKINLQGKYVDKSLKLFFDSNDKGEVIFPKCDCEGSGKPSVLSMWGSCFALFNAIAREIKLDNESKKAWENPKSGYPNTFCLYSNIDNKISALKSNMYEAYREEDYKGAEVLADAVIHYKNILSRNIPKITNTYGNDAEIPYMLYLNDSKIIFDILIDSLYMQGKYEDAKKVINRVINQKCESMPDVDIAKCRTYKADKRNIENKNNELDKEYKKNLEEWKNSLIKRLFKQKPTPPEHYSMDASEEYKIKYKIDNIDYVKEKYKLLADICKKQGERYPEKVCLAAVKDFEEYTKRAQDVIERRKEGVDYIGDLYPEIKEKK